MKLLAIGDNVVDFYKDQGMMYPGGNALNVAVISKRYGAKAAGYLGVIGTDAAADHVVHCMEDEGIDFSRIRVVVGENGEAQVAVNEEGDRVFIGTNRGVRVQSLVTLQLTADDIEYINGYDVIHSSVNSDFENELPKVSHKEVSFDFSTSKKWNPEYLERICPHINYAFFSGSDMQLQSMKDLFELVHRFGVEVVGVTRGERSALFSINGDIFEQPTLPTKVVDTMGAGDSFIAGFLTHYADAKDARYALSKAAEIAAHTCTYYGAFGYGKTK
ncbi:PfkB family carbohydrate kinase [Paenibacillus hamazuiensis]|uniref:PfkB family carbohydrate kinase n=1 Tax=Paenibacillus hamazuiensis TaxID=2936508 RepID=UPI00200D2FC6|nr:PfkB family carbohydrate kinase [Paenibacillus hamazuiensis]